MSKIKGQNLVVLFRGADYQWKALAYATTCELDLNRDMQQVGSASSGNWKHYKPKEMGWTVTSAHLLSDAEQPVDIDKLLVNKYEWCSTGMTHVKDHCDWTFCQEFVNITDLEPLEFDSCEDEEFASAESEADEYYDFEQTVLKM